MQAKKSDVLYLYTALFRGRLSRSKGVCTITEKNIRQTKNNHCDCERLFFLFQIQKIFVILHIVIRN